MASRIALLLLLGAVCVGFTAAQTVEDCCLVVSTKPVPLKLVANYIILEAGNGCDISATVFITKAGRKLCVSHPDDRPWVKSHINYLKAKKTQV
ncbi:C-C motif chemokine 19-like [Sebastes fasciatus]|uniref:C-C motif chemokine 19-like n=1 Tax=Sebastes fasciatus TaxID=394691 RepID=UPI003D9F3FC0